MQNGVVFRRSRKLGSRLIRWGTQEAWSHCGVIIDNEAYHSDSRGCHVSTVEEFCLGSETFFLAVAITKEQKDRAIKAIGYQYDWAAIVWFAIVLLLKRIAIILPTTTVNSKWLVCSEYASYIFWGKGQTVTPGEFLNRVLAEQIVK